MALICKDICQDCVPGQEFFEYGLWMPANKYRPDSDDSSDGESESGGSHSSSSQSDDKGKKPQEDPHLDEALSKLKESYATVAKGKSSVTAAEAGQVARLLNLAPSQEEIRQLKEAKGDNVTQADIEAWLKEIAHGEDDVEHLIKFFQYYDLQKTGKLSKTQIKNLLRSYGEPLTDAEIDAILSEFGMTGDSIDYKEFVTKLLQ